MPNYGSYQALQAQATVDEMVRRGVGIGGGAGGGVGGGSASPYDQVQNASDLIKTITYADAGDRDNERITSIVCSSTSLGLSFTDTYSYAGSAGNYRVTQIVRS